MSIQEFNLADLPSDGEKQVVFQNLRWDAYNRVILCTNLNKLFHITSKNPYVSFTLDLEATPEDVLFTPKHIIVSDNSGMINWYKVDPPGEYPSGKDNDQCLTISDKVDKDYIFRNAFDIPQFYAPASFMRYSRSHNTIIIGTRNGVLGVLPIPSEKIEEDDDEEQTEHVKFTFETKFKIFGRFHTGAVNGVTALGNSTQIASISQDNTIAIWETSTMTQIAFIEMKIQPLTISSNADGTTIFIGTDKGTYRCYDISDRQNPRCIK